jgi:CDP-diglyceride synthetase
MQDVFISYWSIPIICINGCFVIALAWHAMHSEILPSRNNAAMLACAFGVSAVFTPFLLKWAGSTDTGEETMYFVGTIFFSAVLLALCTIVLRNWAICNRHPEEKTSRDYGAFLAALPVNDETRRDNSRKVLHVVISVSPLAVYAIVLALDRYFKAVNILQEYGVSGFDAGRGVNVLIYWSFSFMATMEDLFRLNAFYCIPGWGRRWLRTSIEKKEHFAFTAAVPFLLGHVPLLLAPLPVFFSVSFIASIADAAGSVFGKRFGKHHLPRAPKKTYEGLAAGMIVAFLAVLLVNLAFDPGNVVLAVLMAMALACIFGLFDATITGIDDNYVNTFILGTIAWILYLLLVSW